MNPIRPCLLFIILRVFVLFVGIHFTAPSVCLAQVYEKMFSFTDSRAEDVANSSNKGLGTDAGLVQDSDGDFYGTTAFGDDPDNDLYGYGTVFKTTAGGVLTTLVEFTGNGPTNKGAYPGALVQGNDGNFYGTTSQGGALDYGTVFRMTPDGVLTTPVEFATEEEGQPRADLIRGADGNLYGTTRGPDGSVYRLIFPGAPVVAIANVVQGSVSAVVEAKVNARGRRPRCRSNLESKRWISLTRCPS